MASIEPNTIERFFATRTATLATDTTLAAAARHDFAAITLNIPETTSRTFLSVEVEIIWRCGVTVTAANYTGWRVGIKLGAVAFSDQDFTPTAQANTGDHERGYVKA